MKKTSLIVFFLLIISCGQKQEYYLDFEHKPVPIIISMFNDTEPMKINVFWSVNPLDITDDVGNIVDTIKNAEIRIFENGNELFVLPYIDSLGCYMIPTFIAKTAINYKIKAKVPDYKLELYASSIIPIKTEITKISPNVLTNDNTADNYNDYKSYFMDLDSKIGGGIKYFLYQFEGFYEKKNVFTSDVDGPKIKDPVYYKNKNFYGIDGGSHASSFLFDNRYFVNNKETIELKQTIGRYNGQDLENNRAIILSLSYDLYLYFSSQENLFYRGGQSVDKLIIAEMRDPSFLYSNIKNGSGIFAGYTQSDYSLIYKEIN